MMAAILNSAMLDSDTAILDSDTLLSSLRFTQKHSHSTLTLTQTNSIWLTWCWQPSWILPSWIFMDSAMLHKTLTQSNSIWLKLIHSHWTWWWQPSWSHLEFSHFTQKRTSLMHSHSNWWWQPSWIVPSWIQPFCTKKLYLIILTETWMAKTSLSATLDSAFAQKKLDLINLT